MVLLFHAALMSLGFLCSAGAAATAIFFRKRRWWLKVHRALGYAAGGLAAAGFLAAWWMVAASPAGGHFHVPHAKMGLVTVILILATPTAGALQLRVRTMTPVLRKIHVGLGRISVVLMAITLLMGLLTAELL